MDYQKIFDNAKLLFEYFGWYSLLLVLGTTLIMIPLNILYKKIMANEALSRLRKSISAISVYFIAMGLVALFTHFVIKAPLTFDYLFTSCMSCGLLSMLLWAIIKFVRDYGILPLVKLISESKELQNCIKNLGIDSKLFDVVMKNVDKFIADKNIVSMEDYLKQEMALQSQIRTQINGFVESSKIEEIVKTITSKTKESFNK